MKKPFDFYSKEKSELEKEALRVMKEFAWEHDMPLTGKLYEQLRSR